jgi:hypothetical protein
MRHLAVAVLALCVGAVAPVENIKRDARKVAETWLVLQDGAKYAESWDGLASSQKSEITSEQWRLNSEAMRGATGKLVLRTFQRCLYSEILPGGPEGTYVVVRYSSDFEKHASTDESVTVGLDTDGKWRVYGYRVLWK